MASFIGHIAIIAGGQKLLPSRMVTWKMIILGVVSSVLPDLDVIAYQFGIMDPSPLGHRGITHSIAFAILWSILLYVIFHLRDQTRARFVIIFYACCMASHGLIDGFTNGGAGIAYFYPFSTERYFMPFRIIEVSPLGLSDFFSEWGLKVMKSELKMMLIPSFIIYLLGFLLNRYFYK